MRAPGTLRSVFLSSTSVDLGPYRAAVRAAIERMDQHPVVMENFGAQAHDDATTVSRAQVAESDIYVLLVAWRYGYIPAGQELSVTEQEYDEALANHLPCFVYLADPATDGPNHDDSPQFRAAVRDHDPAYRDKLDAFRAGLLKAHVLGTYTDPGDLAYKVAADLHKHLLKELRAAQARARGVPHDLPPRAPGFVGRARELDELTADLRGGANVALSAAVAGMAGVGKSALAAEVVHTLAADEPDGPERFPGGITWLRCDNLTGLSGLVSLDDQLLAAWNAPLPPELANRELTPEEAVALREQALRVRLRPPLGQVEPAAALVLLDNVEPGLPLGRALATLSALGIRALVTSRAEPAVRGMRVKRLDVLDPLTARSLFAERYTAAEGTWDDARDTDAAAEVAEALGYLPLAIELAAARAGRNRLRVASLAAELRAPDVLAKLRDPLDPTASVRYAFEQTIGSADRPGVLTPTQRARFIALGLPAGTDWPRDVIETYLDGVRLEGVEAPSGADDLDALVALSLVALTTPTADVNFADAFADAIEPAHIRLHSLLRQFAADIWQQQSVTNCLAGIRALLAALYPFVTKHKPHFATLAREEGLITAVLLQDQVAVSEDAARTVIAIINRLTDYLSVGGHWTLGVTLLTRQLALRREVGDRAGEGPTLSNLGSLADNLGRNDEAAAYYEQALAISRELGDRSGEGATLNNLGLLARHLGQLEKARDYFQQALAILRKVGDRSGEGATLNNLGLLARSLGHNDEAADYYKQALVICQEVGNRAGEGTTLTNLGALAANLGRNDEAADFYEQALTRARTVGDRAGEGTTLNNLGALAKSLGRNDEAANYYDQALAISKEVGDRAGEGTTLNNLGKLARRLGRNDEAAVFFEQALSIAQEVRDRSGEGTALSNLGLLANDLGRKEEAQRYYAQALDIFQEIGAVDLQREVQDNLDTLRARHNESADQPANKPDPAPRKRRWWRLSRRDG